MRQRATDPWLAAQAARECLMTLKATAMDDLWRSYAEATTVDDYFAAYDGAYHRLQHVSHGLDTVSLMHAIERTANVVLAHAHTLLADPGEPMDTRGEQQLHAEDMWHIALCYEVMARCAIKLAGDDLGPAAWQKSERPVLLLMHSALAIIEGARDSDADWPAGRHQRLEAAAKDLRTAAVNAMRAHYEGKYAATPLQRAVVWRWLQRHAATDDLVPPPRVIDDTIDTPEDVRTELLRPSNTPSVAGMYTVERRRRRKREPEQTLSESEEEELKREDVMDLGRRPASDPLS